MATFPDRLRPGGDFKGSGNHFYWLKGEKVSDIFRDFDAARSKLFALNQLLIPDLGDFKPAPDGTKNRASFSQRYTYRTNKNNDLTKLVLFEKFDNQLESLRSVFKDFDVLNSELELTRAGVGSLLERIEKIESNTENNTAKGSAWLWLLVAVGAFIAWKKF